MCWHFKVLGFKYDSVTRVSPIMYLEIVFALIFDIALFHVHFTKLQVSGIAIVIAGFLVQIIQAYIAENRNVDPAVNTAMAATLAKTSNPTTSQTNQMATTIA